MVEFGHEGLASRAGIQPRNPVSADVDVVFRAPSETPNLMPRGTVQIGVEPDRRTCADVQRIGADCENKTVVLNITVNPVAGGSGRGRVKPGAGRPVPQIAVQREGTDGNRRLLCADNEVHVGIVVGQEHGVVHIGKDADPFRITCKQGFRHAEFEESLVRVIRRCQSC